MLRLLPTAFLTVLFTGTIGLQLARADIYTWVDATGNINLSNIAPPESVHITNVVHAMAQPPVAREAARQAEVQALEDRVRQLESEAQRQPPPQQIEYRPAPPPVIQYIVNSAPPAAAYADPAPAPNYAWNYGCDQTQLDCGLGGWPGIYPASVVFLPVAGFRPFRSPVRGHPISVRQPMRGGGIFRAR